ncbi:hypothetical protein ACFOGJ_16065 [Marinibaculum pumilum]|uniref:Uncharacterized protein n=1 Tax=Marinibaculum pumilum TaxID=1766165 RepID=A0ABV7L299_9PROT
MSGFTKGLARVEAGTTLIWGEAVLADDGSPDVLGVPIAEARTALPYWARRRFRDGEPEANAELIAAVFTTATALHASGYDAHRVMEAVPGMVEKLARFITAENRWTGMREWGAEKIIAQEGADALFDELADLLATLRTDAPAPAPAQEAASDLAAENAALRAQVEGLAEACEAAIEYAEEERKALIETTCMFMRRADGGRIYLYGTMAAADAEALAAIDKRIAKFRAALTAAGRR